MATFMHLTPTARRRKKRGASKGGRLGHWLPWILAVLLTALVLCLKYLG